MYHLLVRPSATATSELLCDFSPGRRNKWAPKYRQTWSESRNWDPEPKLEVRNQIQGDQR